MKKYLGSLFSFVGGVLVFVFLSLNQFAVKTTIANQVHTSYLTGWELLKEEADSVNGLQLYKIATIVAIVLASLAIISSVILAFKNAKIFKSKFNFNFVNQLILTLLALSLIVGIVALFIMGNSISIALTKAMPACLAFISTICSIALSILNFIFVRK